MASTLSGQGKRSRGAIHYRYGSLGTLCSSGSDRTVSLFGGVRATCKRCLRIVARAAAAPEGVR